MQLPGGAYLLPFGEVVASGIGVLRGNGNGPGRLVTHVDRVRAADLLLHIGGCLCCGAVLQQGLSEVQPIVLVGGRNHPLGEADHRLHTLFPQGSLQTLGCHSQAEAQPDHAVGRAALHVIGDAGSVHTVVFLVKILGCACVERMIIGAVGSCDALPILRGEARVCGQADIRGIGLGGVILTDLIVRSAVGVDQHDPAGLQELCKRVHAAVFRRADVQRSAGAPGQRLTLGNGFVHAEIIGAGIGDHHAHVTRVGDVGFRLSIRRSVRRSGCVRRFAAALQADLRPEGRGIAVHSAVGGFPKEEIPVADQAAVHVIRSGLHRPNHPVHASGVGRLPRSKALQVGFRTGLPLDPFDRRPGIRPLIRRSPERIDRGEETDRKQSRKQNRNGSFHGDTSLHPIICKKRISPSGTSAVSVRPVLPSVTSLFVPW